MPTRDGKKCVCGTAIDGEENNVRPSGGKEELRRRQKKKRSRDKSSKVASTHTRTPLSHMAAPKYKNKDGGSGGDTASLYAASAETASDDDDDDGGDAAKASQVERQYYWLQLLEFKVLPRINKRRGDGEVPPPPTRVPKTTSDTVRVTVRPLGKARKRRTATAASSASPAPPGSGSKRRRT